MSISDTIAALQAINGDLIDNANPAIHAPSAFPASLPSAHLPMALVWPREAESYPAAHGLGRVNRNYLIMVFVKPIKQGSPINEGMQEAITILNSFIEQYTEAAGDTLYVSGGTQVSLNASDTRPHTDNGVQILQYPMDSANLGTTYWGFELTIRVTEKFQY